MASINGAKAALSPTRKGVDGREKASTQTSTNFTMPKYTVQVPGHVGFTNSPDSNRVGISFLGEGPVYNNRGGKAVFRLTNAEPHAILLWNVRVQTRTSGAGTDGFGWDTVSSDYPNGTQARWAPGTTGEFWVDPPDKAPWRVCIIYSIDWADSGNHASGDYEVCGREIRGDVTGRVTLAGQPPKEVVLQDLMNHPVLGPMHKEVVTTRHYRVSSDGGLADVFVYVRRGLEGKTFKSAGAAPVLRQGGGLYEPYVLGVMTRQKFKLQNSDPVMHNLYAMAKINRPINIATLTQGQEVELSFDQPELMIRCKGDLDNGMQAYVNVVDNPFFAVTDSHGDFTISGLPPGDYTLDFVHPKGGKAVREIEVGGFGT